MIILELACLGIRSFRQVTKLTLKPGLNIIQGRTGSGKTTLVECLKVLLFGAPVETLGPLSIPAGGTAQAAVTVKLRNGDIYRVIRDFGKDMLQILKFDMGTRAFTQVASDPSALAALWSAECDGLTLSDAEAVSVWSPRTSPPTGAAAETPPWGSDSLSAGPAPAAAIVLTPEQRAAKVEQLAQLQGRLARAEQQAESADERANAVAQEADVRRKLAALDALAARREGAAARKDEMAPFLQGPENLDALLDGYIKAVPSVETERTELTEESAALAIRVEEAASRPFLKAPMFWAGAGVTALSFIVALTVALSGWFRAIYLVGLVAGLGLLVASLMMDFRRLAAKRAAEDKLADVQKKLTRLDDRLKKTYAAPVALIAQTNSGDAETFKAKRRAAKEWAAELRAFDEQETAMLAGKTRADLDAEWQAAKARADALVRQGGDEVDVESLRDAIRKLTQELDSAPAPSSARSAPAQPAAAGAGFGFAPVRDHAADIGRCLAKLSNARLDAVCELNGSVGVKRRGATDAAPIEALSSGEAIETRLAITLGSWAARRAGLGLPLILDDPLSGLDQEARHALIAALAALVGDRQILLLTNAPVPAAAGLTQIPLPAA
jgi:energy-coupling factor transporter ATP-binding protein EcfA2